MTVRDRSERERGRRTRSKESSSPEAQKPDSPTKKEQIVSLFMSGVNEIEDLAALTQSRPSYVASVLQQEGFMTGYFDLYTSTSNPMNAYSKFFAGRMGFKDLETTEESIALIDRLHEQFARISDRAGQHHALMMALIMYNRARWTGKNEEADVFRKWLTYQLQHPNYRSEEPIESE